jgi:hypothetical protein
MSLTFKQALTAAISDNTFRVSEGCYASGKTLLSSNTGGYTPHMGMVSRIGTETWRTRSNKRTAK